jgi:glutaconyl-CoA/methylmalonyl-CoA decarboxylase subunit gamma
MKKYSFSINNIKYDVDIQSVDGSHARLEVNGISYNVEIHREVKQLKTPVIIRSQVKEVSKDIEKKTGGAKTEIKSPLPGIIVKIYVSKGEEVKKNQRLFSLEAMKMENEIKAERDGVIENIKVTAGQSVLQEEIVMEMN